jgi:hypothetical protein
MKFVPLQSKRRYRAGILLLSAAGLSTLTTVHAQQSAAPLSFPGPMTVRKPLGQAVRAGISRNFALLPLAFERNQGQIDPRAQFLVRQPHSTLFLTATEAVFALDAQSAGNVAAARSGHSGAVPKAASAAVLRMQLVGGNGKAQAQGEQALPARANYFVGADRSRWQSGVSTFAKARYRGVYRGVDMVYYGSRRQLEYDFVLAPHADPCQLALQFAGAEKVCVDRAGDLQVKVQGRTLTWRKPAVYQQNRIGRQRVACRYTVSRNGHGKPTVRFALGRYDADRQLVIDPALVYSTFLGGSIGDSGAAIALDTAGNAYITGYTSSADFPTMPGGYQTANRSASRANAFVTKLNARGTGVVYSTYLGGTGYEAATSIALDSSGNAYLTGETDSTDFPTTTGAYQTTNLSGATAFVTKLDAAGTSLLYSTYLGGSGGETGNGIALDSTGNAYITGYTSSTDFPTTVDAFQTTNRSNFNTNAFVTKLNATGTALLYSTYVGGGGYESGNGIAVDSAGSAYITGYSGSADFPTTSDAYQATNHSASRTNAFVTKLNADGTGLIYSTYLGGTGYESGNGIALDSSGGAYITGYTGSTDFPTTSGAYQRTKSSLGGSSVFVTKLNADGRTLIASTYLGGTGYESGNGIALDSAGHPFLTGYTVSTDFPTTAGANQTTKRNISTNLYGFVTKMDPTLTRLLYSTYLGGTVGDKGNAIAVDAAGYAYVSGSSNSADFPIMSGAYQSANKGVRDGNGFITKLDPNVSIPPVSTDFNNDGKSDLFLQNRNTGQITAWFMNAFNRVGGSDFSRNPGVDYDLVGQGDFKRDGTVTLVLQNRNDNSIVYWYADGANHATITGGDNVYPTPAAGWKVVGIGDFNADGKSDLVFQNQTTNQVAIWFMDGPYYRGGVLMPYTPVAGYHVVGVGDFNKDGSPDLVFQNQNTGQIVIWYMSGAVFSGGDLVNAAIAPGWTVVGVADYNGDGVADLLFQDQATNRGAIWFMNGTTYLGGSVFSTNPGSGWRIAGPK